MDSLLSQDIKKKSVYSIISELKRLPTIPPLETVHSLISVDENSSTSLLKLFCVSAWILNKNKIKPIPNNWLSLLDLLLLKAEEFANSKAIHIHLESNFTEKDQGTLNKFLDQWVELKLVDETRIELWRSQCANAVKTIRANLAQSLLSPEKQSIISHKRSLEPGEIDEAEESADQHTKRRHSRNSNSDNLINSTYDFNSDENYFLCLTIQALCISLNVSSEVQNCSFRLLHEFLLGSNCVLVDEQIRSPLVIACVWLAEVLPEKLVAFLNLTHESPVVSLDSASAQTVTPTSANSTTPDTLDSSKLLENSIKSVENSILHFIQFDFGSVSVSPLSRLQSHSESSSSSQRPSTLIQSIGTLATQCNDSILEGSIRKCSNPAILFYPTSALYAPADIAASLIMITTRDKHMFDSSRGGRLAEMLGLDVSVARQICKELQRQSEVYVLKKDLVDSVFAVMGRRNRDPRSAQNIINEVSPALHNDYSQISFPPPSPPASSARSATLEIVNSRMSRSSSNHARNSKSNEQYSNRPNRRSRERSFDRNATFVEVQHRDSFTESYRRDDYDRHRGEQQSYINGGYNYWSRDTQRGYIDERHYDRHFQDHSRHPYFEDIRGSRDNFSRQESYGRENDGYRRNDDRHARNPMHRPDDYRRRDDRRDDYDDWEWERANPQPYGATYPAAASKSRR